MTITLGQLITWLIIGALAGSLAGALVRRRRRGYGLAVNLTIGLIGALLGGVIFRLLSINLGLGQMVLNASNFLRTDIVIMGIVVIGVVAYLFDLLMRWVERRVVPWKGRM